MTLALLVLFLNVVWLAPVDLLKRLNDFWRNRVGFSFLSREGELVPFRGLVAEERRSSLEGGILSPEAEICFCFVFFFKKQQNKSNNNFSHYGHRSTSLHLFFRFIRAALVLEKNVRRLKKTR
jgi:hypothetical protein